MDILNELYDLCDVISKEIAEANEKIRQAGGKLTGSDLEYVDKLTHILKSIKTTVAMIEAEDGYNSYDNGSYDNYNDSYHGGSSYARGRGRNARRDSMGRYSSARGYSRHGDIADELRKIMHDAPNDQIKKDIQRLVDKVDQM